MNSDSPGWQPVDPSGISSVALPEAPPPGQLLVFASSAFEDDRPWVAETVAEIAREWADSAVRLLLMDLDLQGPGIHDAFDAEAAEGVSDVLLFGASISRVTQPVEGGAFHYAPAGTPVADPRVILSNDRWERVIRGCRDAGISLVVHLPLGQPGAESLLFRADRIVRLGRPHESGGGIPSELEDRVVATLTPAGVEEAPIVEIHELAPDDPVRRIEELAPEGDEEAVAEAPDEPVVDIAALAPDEPVVDVEELAPDEPVAERSGEAPVESDEEPASEPAAGAPEVVEAAT
ncbi:MAG: hypothetical protein ACOC8K_10165, partial [Gemmatimonadota bacterium]